MHFTKLSILATAGLAAAAPAVSSYSAPVAAGKNVMEKRGGDFAVCFLLCFPFAEWFPVFLACLEGCEVAAEDGGEVAAKDFVVGFADSEKATAVKAKAK
ncbi:hypothetical protein QBC34DRAFT_460351 [Podospora aff. communis PSN243]|uniref:Uncharacterized protein n=1 Tax=Podospora aff. communis PSN243 TaxID=3040156 RepID=A0AAV9H2Z7_9PEZI|nr:hypothetical protein QBC34DRAFT_460351 [Podospora aff. communis PSN243]